MDKNFEFPQFWGFSENVNILGYGHFSDIFWGSLQNLTILWGFALRMFGFL